MKCANCGNTQGPFYPIFEGGPRVCNNTKQEKERILQCVERRRAQHIKEGHDELVLSRSDVATN